MAKKDVKMFLIANLVSDVIPSLSHESTKIKYSNEFSKGYCKKTFIS